MLCLITQKRGKKFVLCYIQTSDLLPMTCRLLIFFVTCIWANYCDRKGWWCKQTRPVSLRQLKMLNVKVILPYSNPMPPMLSGICQYYIVWWYLVYFPVSSDLMRRHLLLSFHTSQGDFALLCHRELNTIWENREFLIPSSISYMMFKKFKSHAS